MSRIRESKFRGNSISKVVRSSLGVDPIYKPPSSPTALISELQRQSQLSSPSFSALSILAESASKSSAYFYPPQILQTLSLFGEISYSATELFSFLISRKTCLLNEASPKRLVELLRAMAALNLPIFHQAIWPELRAQLVQQLPQIRRGVPSIINSLSRQDCADEELVEALITQSVCTKNLIGESFFQAAKLGFGKIRLLEYLRHDHPIGETIYLVSALYSLQLEIPTPLIGKIRERFTEKDPFKVGRLITRVSRCGLSDFFQIEISNFAESCLSNPDFARSFLPYIVSDIACPHMVDLVVKSQLGHAKNMSAEKLLHLISVAKEKEEWIELIKPIARQLTVRDARRLWEFAPGLVPVHALVPLLRSDSAVCKTVGPYVIEKTNDEKYEYVLPYHAIYSPGNVIRPNIVSRRLAIQQEGGVEVDIQPIRQRSA